MERGGPNENMNPHSRVPYECRNFILGNYRVLLLYLEGVFDSRAYTPYLNSVPSPNTVKASGIWAVYEVASVFMRVLRFPFLVRLGIYNMILWKSIVLCA